jgi:hypothetical protein
MDNLKNRFLFFLLSRSSTLEQISNFCPVNPANASYSGGVVKIYNTTSAI